MQSLASENRHSRHVLFVQAAEIQLKALPSNSGSTVWKIRRSVLAADNVVTMTVQLAFRAFLDGDLAERIRLASTFQYRVLAVQDLLVIEDLLLFGSGAWRCLMACWNGVVPIS